MNSDNTKEKEVSKSEKQPEMNRKCEICRRERCVCEDGDYSDDGE